MAATGAHGSRILEDLPDVAGQAGPRPVRLQRPAVTADGAIIDDDLRIRAARAHPRSGCVDRGADVTACSHLGRPKGKPDPAKSDARRCGRASPSWSRAVDAARQPALGSPGEEADNDPAFVDRLVAGQDLYVDDAFGAPHRAHASIVGPPGPAPERGRPPAGPRGRGAERRCCTHPTRPFVAVLGGSKVATSSASSGRCSTRSTR